MKDNPTYANLVTYRDPVRRKWYGRVTAGKVCLSFSAGSRTAAEKGARELAEKLKMTVVGARTKPGMKTDVPVTLPLR